MTIRCKIRVPVYRNEHLNLLDLIEKRKFEEGFDSFGLFYSDDDREEVFNTGGRRSCLGKLDFRNRIG